MNLLASLAAPPVVRVPLDAEAGTVQRPPLSLLGSEPLRAVAELARHALMPNPAAARPGDGHPVVIFPGLGSDGLALAPLRSYCASLGYRAMGWDYGRNTGPKGDIDAWLDTLADHTRTLLGGDRRQATFLGWSLGGLYARELAKRMPRRVRQVITFGTPFNLADDHTNVGWVLRLLNGPSCELDAALCARLREPPPVPTTSIYSRADGVVAWEACRHDIARGDVQDLEVEGSHLGMGWNPAVMRVVADRLALRRSRWRPMRCAA